MQKPTVSAWGNFPETAGDVEIFNQKSDSLQKCIPQGNLRSYGDSALASKMLSSRNLDCFLGFDESSGVLHCQSGVLLADLIKHFVPRGWFPLIFPGTQFITIGGAIASDVHGKNHHHHGAFSESVIELTLLTADDKHITCSKNNNQDWFRHTCGGMGLTGFILEAKIQLQRISSSNIKQTTFKTKNLEETFELFEKYHNAPYSVAWLDCLAKGKQLGRSILTIGEHADDNVLQVPNKPKLNIPFFLPSASLNAFTLKIINTFLYQKVIRKQSQQLISYEKFFFPLDGINNWNKAYGKNGFVQYQFVLPLENSLEGLREILGEISKHRQGSLLTVLKRLGKENNNSLSFPEDGYTLAIDFNNNDKAHKLLSALDKLVIKYKGRFYLAKDSRVTKSVFESGYPRIEDFRNFRKENKLDQYFSSLQSERLSL